MPTTTSKHCPMCKTTKDPRGFYSDRTRQYGLSYACRACTNVIQKRRRDARVPSEDEEHGTMLTGTRCDRCLSRQHGPLCRGPGSGCPCRCRAMLGLEGPFEFGDPTVPTWDGAR